jgi:hypothetical protein
MGWNPFKKTVTSEYWNVVTASMSEDSSPDSFHDFAIINDAVNGIEYFKSIEYLHYYGGRRATLRQLTNKLSTETYYQGFAEVNIGNNYVPASLVKARINPSDPSAVTITNSSITVLDYAGWASAYFVNEFGLNVITNRFIVDNVEFSVDFSTANSVDNTIEITNITTSIATVLDLPPEPVGSAYNVTYTVTTAGDPPIVSSVRTWTYEIGSGVYPELDTYTTLPENDPTVFQILPPLDIRRDGNFLYNDVGRHADYDDYAERLGIDSEAIADEFAKQDNMDKLDHVTINYGVKLKAQDKHSLRYCIDFIKKLKALAYTHTFDYEVNGTTDNVEKGFNTQDTYGYTDAANTTSETSHSYTAKELVDVPGIDLIISFDDVAYGIKYSHIEIQHHTKTQVDANSVLSGVRDDPIDESIFGRVRTKHKYKSIVNNDFANTSTITGVTIPPVVWGWLNGVMSNLVTSTVSTITYYKINEDDSLDSYMIVGPVMAHYVRDAQSGKHKLVYINLQSAEGDINFPLDWRIVKGYNNQVLTALSISSIHFVMYYAYWEQKEVWNWNLIMIIIMVVVYYFCQSCGEAMRAWWAGMSTTMQVVFVAAQLAAMGVFGEDYIVLGQLVSLYLGFAGSSGATVGANLATANAAITVIDIMNTSEMLHIMSDAEAIASLEISQELLKDAIQDGLDEEYKASGYYYSAINRGYIQQALVNIRKVDTLVAMPSERYFQRVLKTTSPRHTYRLQYKYT